MPSGGFRTRQKPSGVVGSYVTGLLVLQGKLGPKTLDWNWISNNLSDEIIPAVVGHIYLSFISVTIALAISLPTVVAGMDSVPEETKDAARGMGLTSRQILFRVELPLALPVIIAGVRIATVTV